MNLKIKLIGYALPHFAYCVPKFYNGYYKLTLLDNSVVELGGGVSWSDLIPYRNNTIKIDVGTSATNLGNFLFLNFVKVSSIEIPNTISEIGDYCFLNNTNLKYLEIPESVINVGSNILEDCNSLKELHWMALVAPSYNNCRLPTEGSLEKVIIGSKVPYIGKDAFKSIKTLKTVQIENGITKIESEAFRYCDNLEKINLPSTIKEIEWGALAYTNITKISIPFVTALSSGVFEGCKKLVEVNIPETITTIENHAFLGCSSLPSIILPSNLTKIDSSAFDNCYKLKSVTCLAKIPPTGGNNTFYSNDDNRKIYVPAESVDAYKTAWSNWSKDIEAIL